MHIDCPRKTCSLHPNSRRIVRHGQYWRSSDSKYIDRFKCLSCQRTFSFATWNACFGQKKRRINPRVKMMIESGVALRQIARKLKIHRKTVSRKRRFWSDQGLLEQDIMVKKQKINSFRLIQMDDMESFEHTKCKPLSISLAVTKGRLVLGFKVSQMPAKGLLAARSRKKYGLRKDQRPVNWGELFKELSVRLRKDLVIVTDQNPHYVKPIKKYFPQSEHRNYKGRAPAKTGQGELKKGGYDPLFSINHTCARIRDLVKPMVRKSWCTAKTPEALVEQLNIFVSDHNRTILAKL